MRWLRLVIISSILVALEFTPLSSVCQTGISDIIRVANNLSRQGLYEQAATEYHRAFFFSIDSINLFNAQYGLGLSYRELGKLQRSEESFRKATAFAPNEKLKNKVLIALSATYIGLDEPNLGILNLLPLLRNQENREDYSEVLFLAITAQIKLHNWNKAKNLIDQLKLICNSLDSDFTNLYQLLEEAENTKPYNPETANLLSTIIPGAGQLYSGDFQNGLKAFALNSMNGWVIINNILQADYLSALLYTAFVAERYYSGNRYRAQQIALETNNKMEDEFQNRILFTLEHLYRNRKI